METIQALREYLEANGKNDRRYLPRRSGNEHLQVIAAVNFQGRSGKTTTAAHLAQYLALNGYRVLAIDLDPQASMSALHGYQPEFDVGENETLTAPFATTANGATSATSSRRPISPTSTWCRVTSN